MSAPQSQVHLRYVLGIGSPHGLDALGWRLVERLDERMSGSRLVFRAARPEDIPLVAAEAGGLALIDARLEAGAELRVERIHPARLADDRALSSHGLGLAEALSLAAALAPGLGDPLLLAVTVDPGSRLGTAIETALPLVQRALDLWLEEVVEGG